MAPVVYSPFRPLSKVFSCQDDLSEKLFAVSWNPAKALKIGEERKIKVRLPLWKNPFQLWFKSFDKAIFFTFSSFFDYTSQFTMFNPCGVKQANSLSFFFQANSLSLFFREKRERKRIHLLGPRTGLFDGTPHGLNLAWHSYNSMFSAKRLL